MLQLSLPISCWQQKTQVWTAVGSINFFDPDIAAKELGLPKNEEVLMLLDLGYAAEGVKPLSTHGQRKPLSQTVQYM